MTIEILPARLANQIAAGEVVERPASVIKELVENSLDAGATQIHIEIEKGGTKKLRISDNGSGIVKNELTLALSRHATSKIKNLNDLESISSLGFRGEALASISSVSRLTITSKPAEQDTAWQACAAGRDMDVTVQPAAHPNGTTIEVKDLFFNTPARRKFLRTEKTEFNHIDEVVRRIALARFDVAFTLSHNGKIIRQYRQAKDKTQYAKRVTQVCGKQFIEHAIEVECQHDNLHLWGWLAKPSFSRSQNDLCYSYVNGRMMRDKLINHAIRQSYADKLLADTYPAFVLFLELDYSEVDVNVHPAKHEVRFHQGRYVHDFIFSVCNDALSSLQNEIPMLEDSPALEKSAVASAGYSALAADFQAQQKNEHAQVHQTQYQQREEYVQPLTQVNESAHTFANKNVQYSASPKAYQTSNNKVSPVASQAYQQLMTPIVPAQSIQPPRHGQNTLSVMLHFIEPAFALIQVNDELRLLSLCKFEKTLQTKKIEQRWSNGFVSQPLLLPVSISLTEVQIDFAERYQKNFEHLGIVLQVKNKQKIQIRQFPALLREKDVNASFTLLLNELLSISVNKKVENSDWHQAIATILVEQNHSKLSAQTLLSQAKNYLNDELEQVLLLNSVPVDLTSQISQLM